MKNLIIGLSIFAAQAIQPSSTWSEKETLIHIPQTNPIEKISRVTRLQQMQTLQNKANKYYSQKKTFSTASKFIPKIMKPNRIKI